MQKSKMLSVVMFLIILGSVLVTANCHSNKNAELSKPNSNEEKVADAVGILIHLDLNIMHGFVKANGQISQGMLLGTEPNMLPCYAALVVDHIDQSGILVCRVTGEGVHAIQNNARWKLVEGRSKLYVIGEKDTPTNSCNNMGPPTPQAPQPVTPDAGKDNK